MKKIINEPGKIVEEMLQGIVKSYGNLVHQVEDSRVTSWVSIWWRKWS